MKKFISATQYNEIYSEDTGILISKNISEDVNYLTEKIKNLQAENVKLREVVSFYADYKNDNPDNDWNNDYARQVLKELEDK